jgi:hypothetical protein
MTGIFPTQETPGDPDEFNAVDQQQLDELLAKRERWRKKRTGRVEHLVNHLWHENMSMRSMAEMMLENAECIVRTLQPLCAQLGENHFLFISTAKENYFNFIGRQQAQGTITNPNDLHRFLRARWQPGAVMRIEEGFLVCYK